MIRRIINGKQYQDALYHYAPYGTAFVDENGKYLGANEFYCHMIGYSERELKNMTWMQLVDPVDVGSIQEDARDLVERIKPRASVELKKITKLKKFIWVSLTAFAIFDGEKFKHIVFHATELPNGGTYRIERGKKNEIYIRPIRKLTQFVSDNKPFLLATGAIFTAIGAIFKKAEFNELLEIIKHFIKFISQIFFY